MAKQSGLDKIIKELQAEIEEHKREIDAIFKLIQRLEIQRPVKRSKPRVVKKADEKAS